MAGKNLPQSYVSLKGAEGVGPQRKVRGLVDAIGNIQKTLDDFSTKGCELVATSVVPETPPKSLSTEQIILICRNR